VNDKQVLLLMLAKARASFGVREYWGNDPEEDTFTSGIEFRTRAGELACDFYFDANGNLMKVYTDLNEGDINEDEL
jgi:hypothetical protein